MKKEKALYQVSLKALLKNSKGEILALKALGSGSFSGFYDFPGGRIDSDEFSIPLSDILAREIREEIGNIQFKIYSSPVGVGRHLIPAAMTSGGVDKQVLYLFFEVDYLGGEIKISDEHTDYKWLNLKEIDPKQYFKSGVLEGVEMYLRFRE
ncbi:MAG: hypothetical protein G01um101418_761 [Parcubacteria group bacterium Gr01-1014_18]|nr:MAG: hypothetical protein Greene041636_769 [Parcubacteria group bacterium Greene0416_36]TSC80126.1 MAG: hypothetical protein G01um101418_761 [Parcubacteria group bacterium Gr01-1014_18]TSC99340.1 MAG: hypothetical protein Greene101420_268 [Parcubacteria group bacterium Greene1014_20]TSD06823.1 MAG: hypothetical protein Greene07142_557 [Parcubacteria group bacterium Greene0714_2]